MQEDLTIFKEKPQSIFILVLILNYWVWTKNLHRYDFNEISDSLSIGCNLPGP